VGFGGRRLAAASSLSPAGNGRQESTTQHEYLCAVASAGNLESIADGAYQATEKLPS